MKAKEYKNSQLKELEGKICREPERLCETTSCSFLGGGRRTSFGVAHEHKVNEIVCFPGGLFSSPDF